MDEERRFTIEGPVDYEKRLAALEHEYLFGNAINSKKAVPELAKLKQLRARLFPADKALPIEEFYEASAKHEELLEIYVGLSKFIKEKLASVGRDMKTMTDDEYASLSASYPEIAAIEAMEDAAIAAYATAGSKGWERPKIADHRTAQLNGLNLRYERALRIRDGRERERVTGEILEQTGRILDLMPPGGIKGEWEVIYLVNKWARDNGRSGAIRMVHNATRSDVKTGDDASLYLGEFRIAQQIKTTSELGDAEEQAAIRARAEGRVFFSTSVVQFPLEALSRLFARDREGADKETVVNIIAAKIKDESALSYLALLFKAKKEGRPAAETPQNLIKELPRIVNVDWLIGAGALADSDRGDAGKVIAAKKTAIEKLSAGIRKKKLTSRDQLDQIEL
jgi:hypothetical protein